MALQITSLVRSNFLTRRRAYSSSSLGLTETQVRMDANLRHFIEEASDISNLVAMTTGSLAFKFTQTGLGALGLFKHASSVLALGVEATVYRGSSNLLAEARGLTPAENVFDGRGWATTFTHFGTLKGASYFVRGQNVFFSHTVQSLGMVGGSQLTYAMHLTARPQGNFFEQMMEAERANIALGAGTALMGRLTGHRLQVIEKSLDLRAEVLSARPLISGYENTFLSAPALLRMGAAESRREIGTKEPVDNLISKKEITYNSLTTQSFFFRWGLTIATSVISHSFLAPLVTEAITGRSNHHNFSQHLMTAGLMAFTSLGVVLGSLPIGHLIQRPDLGKNKKISSRTVASASLDLCLATISQIGVALIYHKDLATAALNGVTRGFTRGFPLGVIYRDWGDRPLRANVLRQMLQIIMMTNATTVTSLASEPEYQRTYGDWLKTFTVAEIAALSAILFLGLSVKKSERWLGKKAKV